MHWYHKEMISPFLLFRLRLQRALELYHSREVPWWRAAQRSVSSAGSFWADVEDHGAEKLERGSQILVLHIRRGRLLFHSCVRGVTSEDEGLQSLPWSGEGRMGPQLVQMLLNSHCLKSPNNSGEAVLWGIFPVLSTQSGAVPMHRCHLHWRGIHILPPTL